MSIALIVLSGFAGASLLAATIAACILIGDTRRVDLALDDPESQGGRVHLRLGRRHQGNLVPRKVPELNIPGAAYSHPGSDA